MDVLDQILSAGSFEEVQRIVENSTDEDFAHSFLENDGPEPTDIQETGDDMANFEKEMAKSDKEKPGSSSDKPEKPSTGSNSGGLGSQNNSALLTEQELADIYTECVAEVIRESKAKINEKYKKKKADAKKFKAKQLADAKKKSGKDDVLDIKGKKKGVKESASVNEIMDDIFSQF